MNYYSESGLLIRSMVEEDISALHTVFSVFDKSKTRELFQYYYSQYNTEERIVLIAELEGGCAGYVTLVPNAKEGPFKDKKIPEIKGFNVIQSFRKKGIGWKLMDVVEQCASKQSDIVLLGVGLYRDYGTAHRMYVKRGYIPDGTGLWYGNQQIFPGNEVFVDDDLVLYMSKSLNVTPYRK